MNEQTRITTFLYLDFETKYDQMHSLSNMILREYLNWTEVTGLAYQIGTLVSSLKEPQSTNTPPSLVHGSVLETCPEKAGTEAGQLGTTETTCSEKCLASPETTEPTIGEELHRSTSPQSLTQCTETSYERTVSEKQDTQSSKESQSSMIQPLGTTTPQKTGSMQSEELKQVRTIGTDQSDSTPLSWMTLLDRAEKSLQTTLSSVEETIGLQREELSELMIHQEQSQSGQTESELNETYLDGLSIELKEIKYATPEDPEWATVVSYLMELFTDPSVCTVSHNSAFDIRVARHCLGFPQPVHDHCTLELSKAAFPSQLGGHSLKNLGEVLPDMPQKLSIDLRAGKHTKEELDEYCCQDVRMCSEIHGRALSRLSKREIIIHEMTTRARELYFEIQPELVDSAIESFSKSIQTHAIDLIDTFQDRNARDVLGWEGDEVKSIKPAALKELLYSEFGFRTDTITKKKINPAELERNKDAARAIEAASMANKNLSHKRRVRNFRQCPQVDVAFMYYAAHTGRWSGKGTGKGVNIHNLPKHNYQIAKPLRSIFRLPPEKCFVRVDLANVEYRCQCWATDCAHGTELFQASLLADPYAAFWNASTGQVITKKDPIRQVAKVAVLGLGYIMGVGTWMTQLMSSIADPAFNVSIEDLTKVCADQGWRKSRDSWVNRHAKKIYAPWQVATVAEHTRKLFHQIHPEFQKFADWLLKAVEIASRSLKPEIALEEHYKRRGAPDPSKILVEFDDSRPGERGLKVTCGYWTNTIFWRDLAVRRIKQYGEWTMALTMMREGNRRYRAVTKNIVIENVIQSLARNALCEIMLQLKSKGHTHILSVHDELLIAVDRNPSAVLKARKDLLDIVGPGSGGAGYDWAVVIDPTEIECSQSWWAEAQPESWWNSLQSKPELLESLP